MAILSKNELSNVLVIVTRYFGGILLGAGGIVRAYSTDYSSKAIYLYSGDFLSYATSISAVDGEKVGLKLGQEVILAGTKTTDKDGVVYLKNIIIFLIRLILKIVYYNQKVFSLIHLVMLTKYLAVMILVHLLNI